MTNAKFAELTPEQMWAMVIAHEVRNGLEVFHASSDYDLIPDALMTELNHAVRQRILSIVYSLMHPEEKGCRETLEWAVRSIPDFWEVPVLTEEQMARFRNGLTELSQVAMKARVERAIKEREQWERQALTPSESQLVVWFKKTFTERNASIDPMRIKPEEILGEMKSLGFQETGWQALAWWGNIFCRAKLGRWIAGETGANS